jgi:hypothetical protein
VMRHPKKDRAVVAAFEWGKRLEVLLVEDI